MVVFRPPPLYSGHGASTTVLLSKSGTFFFFLFAVGMRSTPSAVYLTTAALFTVSGLFSFFFFFSIQSENFFGSHFPFGTNLCGSSWLFFSPCTAGSHILTLNQVGQSLRSFSLSPHQGSVSPPHLRTPCLPLPPNPHFPLLDGSTTPFLDDLELGSPSCTLVE